jgi:inorganic phosphate transporter, PiT family
VAMILLLGAVFLAFSNGANDNFKGFATVWGSGTLSYRRAIALATIATLLGSLVSVILAETLVQQFSGRGLVPNGIAGSTAFVLSVSLGAAGTVWLATRIGIPVSTTHALIGALVGAGLTHGEGTVNFDALLGAFVLPLLFSPLAAASLGLIADRLLRMRPVEKDCACLVLPQQAASVAADGSIAHGGMELPRIVLSSEAACDQLPAPALRTRVSTVLDRLHTLSAASICFARAVNDTPKLVALLVAAGTLDVHLSAGLIAVIMAAGGLAFSHRVAETMSQRIARMDHTQGLAANLISATLILSASKFGLPVSTTHVSVGSIAGVGAAAGSLQWSTLRTILLSWVATLPLAALLAAAAAWLAQRV